MKKELQLYLISDQQDSKDTFLDLSASIKSLSGWHDDLEMALDEVPEDSQIVVVEPKSSEALSMIKAWTAEHPDIDLYVVTSSKEADDVRNYMRSGVRDVFLKPLQVESILKEIQQAMSERESAKEGKLITFIDAKGGNGCTTLAVNVAEEIARTEKTKVLLIDFDIQFGDVAALMDLDRKNTVLEAISQSERLDPSLLSSLVTEAEHGLHVLLSPEKIIELDTIKAVDVKKLLELAIHVYDIVVIDLPRVITPWVSEVLRWSDHVFLVLQGSVSDVRDGHLMVKHFKDIGVNHESIHYLHNRAGDSHASVHADQIRKSFNTERLFSVRSDFNVASHSADLGKAITEYSKMSKLSKDIKSLASLIMEMCGYEQEKEPGMFAKLFQKHGGRN